MPLTDRLTGWSGWLLTAGNNRASRLRYVKEAFFAALQQLCLVTAVSVWHRRSLFLSLALDTLPYARSPDPV